MNLDSNERPRGRKKNNGQSGPQRLPRIGLGKRIAFSVIVTVLVLCVAEGTLACFWNPPPPEDPFVGFSPSVPLIIEQERAGDDGSTEPAMLQINPAKLVWFNDQTFAAVKPKETYRIVCVGGSTTYGRPFDDTTSFCGWLRQLLPVVDPNQKWEVINAGGISYASYRIANVMEQFAEHDVDLFVLYTGQNEFLEWRTYGDLMESSETPRLLATLASKTRLGQSIKSLVDRFRGGDDSEPKQMMPGEVDEMLNHSVGPVRYQRDTAWFRGVEEHFRVNLLRMAEIAEAAEAKLAVVTPASNLSDCSPFKADFGDAVDDPTRQRLNQDLDTARALSADGATAAALEVLELILLEDQQNADVHFLLGRAQLDVGRFDIAAESFQRAIDEDICPLRATTSIKQIIREFLQQTSVIAVDFESHLMSLQREKVGHVCFGAETFLDHVHPTVDVHREIAMLVTQRLVDQGIVSRMPSPQETESVIANVEQRIDLRAQGVAFRNLAKLNHWAGKFEEAQRNARDALRLLPADLESRFILADCLQKAGQTDAAIDQYRRLFEIGDFDRAFQPYGELLAAQGQSEAAKAYLMQAVFASSGRRQASAFEALGRLHESLGEQELADECFENARQLR